MLNLHETHFPPQCEHEPHCTPPKPRFNLHEDMEKTIVDMRHTIGRMLDFERQLNEKVETMLKQLTADNVTFKETFNEAYRVFLNDVRSEVNGFEGDMTNSFRLFTTTIEANYAELSNECKAQISEYYNDIILFIKTNINGALKEIIEEMRADGSLDGVIQSEVVVTPEMYGAKGDGVTDDTVAIRSMFATRKNYLFKGTYVISESVAIPEGAILTSNNATFVQNTFGNGVFRTTNSNIHFKGTFNFVQNGAKTKLDTEGVECSAFRMDGSASHITIDRFNIKGFIGGVVFGGSNHDDVIVRKIYVENCDFGVWGANAHNVVIDVVEFKNVDNSQNEPAHAVYFTGNDAVIKSSNIRIGVIHGEGCDTATTDSVLSVKATSDFHCGGMCVKYVSKVFDVLNSSGCIENINASGVHSYCFTVQGTCADGKTMNVRDGKFTNISNDTYAYNVGASASTIIERCNFDGTTSNGYAYISNVSHFEERDCVYKNSRNDATIKCYHIASSDHAVIHNPTVSGMGLVRFINSGVNFVFEIDPSKLCSYCNDVTYKTVYLPNEHFAVVSDIDNNNLYNNIIATDSVIIKLRGNGIFTIINKDNGSAIMDNGTGALVLKDGRTQYTADEWKVKLFRVIDSVGYEI